MAKLIVGCGYLGRRVAALWTARGHSVYGTTRGRADELRALGVEPVVGDVFKDEILRAVPPAETVLYAVSPDGRSGQGPSLVWGSGLAGVLSALAAWSRPPRFLLVSSTGVYGQADGEEVDESAVTEPADETGRALVSAEERAREEVNAVVLRYAGIYGPGRLIRAQTLRAGEPIAADPDKWLNLIHVEDGAAAVLAAEARAAPGHVYNVSDGHPVLRRDFYARLARLLGAPEARFVPPPPDAPARHDRGNRRIVNRRMCEELGVLPRYPSYAEGLAASV